MRGLIGKQEPYLYELTGFVAEHMRPGLSGNDGIRAARRPHREGRRASLRHHVPGSRESIQRRNREASPARRVPGAVSFKLYDTYGLALDEQEDMARERGLEIDREGFEAEMKQQRERARASWKGGEKGAVAPAYQQLLEHRAAPNSWAMTSWTPLRKSPAC